MKYSFCTLILAVLLVSCDSVDPSVESETSTTTTIFEQPAISGGVLSAKPIQFVDEAGGDEWTGKVQARRDNGGALLLTVSVQGAAGQFIHFCLADAQTGATVGGTSSITTDDRGRFRGQFDEGGLGPVGLGVRGVLSPPGQCDGVTPGRFAITDTFLIP